MTTFGIIPARGGSKRLPGKNMRDLCGKPLIAHTIEAAAAAATIDRVVVTTDDDLIAETARRFGAEVVRRPTALATDESRSEDAVRHALSIAAGANPEKDFVVLLQPTSPLRTATHIDTCLSAFAATSAASVISVTAFPLPPRVLFAIADDRLRPLLSGRADQDAVPASRAYYPNGAIFAIPAATLLRGDTFYAEPIFPFVMDDDVSVDIDTETDFHLVEVLMLRASDPERRAVQ